MFLTDITTFIDFFVGLMVSGFTYTYNFLDSITFHGLSLLQFILALTLVPLGVTILIAISKNPVSNSRADYKARQRERKES